VQSYNETLEHSVQDVKLIQSDIGNHVVSISPKKYNLSISSPLIILDHDNSLDNVYDLFYLALENLTKIQSPLTPTNAPSYVFKSANIQLGQECSINAQLEGWQPFNSNLDYITNELDFSARLVKHYDIKFSAFGQNYLISNATLNISVNTSTNYFVSGSNDFYGNVVPLYGIHGYSVSGDVTIVVTPDQYDLLKLYNDQEPGYFNAVSQNISLTIFDRKNPVSDVRKINLGNFMFLPSIELNVNANQAITAKMNFNTMFRGSSLLEY
jgi:hypothetical protein